MNERTTFAVGSNHQPDRHGNLTKRTASAGGRLCNKMGQGIRATLHGAADVMSESEIPHTTAAGGTLASRQGATLLGIDGRHLGM